MGQFAMSVPATRESPPTIVIIGSGRSGTTIVLEAVASLPGVVAVPRLAGRVPRLTGVATALTRWGVGPTGWRRPSAESTALFTEAGITQERQASKGGGPLTLGDIPADRAARLVTRLQTIAKTGRVSCVAIKNTAACGRVPLLAELLPGAVFLHVVRSPSEVVTSLLATDFWYEMTLWWDGRTTTAYARDHGLTHERVAARHWARQVAQAADSLNELPSDRSLQMRYADFTRQPTQELRRLERFGLRAPDPERVAALGIRSSEKRPPVSAEVQDAVTIECREVAMRVGVSL